MFVHGTVCNWSQCDASESVAQSPTNQSLDRSDRPVCALSHSSPSFWRQWLWSFFTCYHFGHYHPVHHRFPRIPWYRLPSCRKTR
ncbi:fatty acid desaturase [Thermoleptolyngbya sp.]